VFYKPEILSLLQNPAIGPYISLLYVHIGDFVEEHLKSETAVNLAQLLIDETTTIHVI
jgi:hypothetical protein